MKILKTLFSVKKLALSLVALVLTLTLVACTNQSGTPYGSVSDEAYLTTNGYTVTQKELYDQLRLSSVSRLTTYIDELMFKDVAINATNKFEVSAFEQEINTALFSSATITATQISKMSERNIAQMILSYVDSFAITNPSANKTQLISFLEEVVADIVEAAKAPNFDATADFSFGYVNKTKYPSHTAAIDSLIEQYTLNVQKQVHAKSILGDLVNGELTGELADEDSSVYIKESDIVTQYKNNIAGQYNVSALIISFTSTKENELARYKYALKSNSRGEWFNIPNLAEQAVVDKVKAASTTDNTPEGKAAKIVVDTLGISLANLQPIAFDSANFATYYANYSVNSAVDQILDDSKENNEVLNAFLTIYDYLHGTNYAVTDMNNLVAGSAHREIIEEALTLTYNSSLLTANTQLRSYVYGLAKESLYYSTIGGANEDGVTYGRPYSRQVQTLGTGSYLVYLLNDERELDNDVLTDSVDDVEFQDNANAKAQRTKALEQLIKAKLTSAYITSKTTEMYEDAKINIYDSILRDMYANQASYEGSTGFKNNEILADVNGTEILVDTFYDEIVDTLGLSTALDLIFVKVLDTNYGDQITEADRKEFRENLEEIIKSFQAGGFEQSGFPASLGVNKFLLLAVGAYAHDGKSATADAIEKLYVNSKLRELFQADLTAQYGDETVANNIYAKFAELAKLQKENQIEISANHLLIYVDFNNDGQNDTPTDALIAEQNLNGITTLAQYEAQVAQLVTIITERAKKASSLAVGLENIVTAYNNSTRFSKFATEAEYLTYLDSLTAEEILEFLRTASDSDVYGAFKRLGLKVMQESLGTISNQTNFPGQQSNLDASFFDYAMDLGKHIQGLVEAGELTSATEILPIFAPDVKTGDAAFSVAKSRSAFGWHLILVTGYTMPLSAKVEDASNDDYVSAIDNPFVTGAKLTAVNATDDLTWEQILIFIEESKEYEGDVVTLPTNVKNAYNKYFAGVYSTYTTSSYVQLELAFDLIFGDSVLTDANLQAQLTSLRQANINQFFNYSYFEGVDGTGSTIYDRAYNAEYAAVYGTWFTILQK